MTGKDGFDHFLMLFFLLLIVFPARTWTEDHRYLIGDHIPLFVNKVGPLNNPSETYAYYNLPFCCPDQVIGKKGSIGEVLSGERITNSQYELNFREGKVLKSICKKILTKDEVAKFRDAVNNDYYFQMYYDDLPLWGFIGKVEVGGDLLNETRPKYYLFKHIQFNVLYHHNQIIGIHAFCDPNNAVDITEDNETEVEFTYSVLWNSTFTRFENRMDKYSKYSFLPEHLEVHWFSVINSIIASVFLMGFLVTVFMRTLKNDLIKYSRGDEQEDKEEVGWKYIHGDVFRYPPHKSLLCAVVAAGTQLLTICFFMFVLALVGVLYPYHHGALYTSLIVIYALTSVVAGYIATSFYGELGGRISAKSLVLTAFLFPGPLFLTFAVLNTVAIAYGSTAALPFGTIVVILLLWAFVTTPLMALGGVIGNIYKSEFQAPCATKKIPTEIPVLAWYRRTPTQMFLAGFLPFTTIFLELHYIFTSMWGLKIYIIYPILLIVFTLLIINTLFLSVGLTYFQLAVEDHEWWWRSVLRGGSTAIFVYGYCFYFYSKSDMTGFMQISYFFGYNACICYAFFLMLGTVGFRASLIFVRHIYRAIKCE